MNGPDHVLTESTDGQFTGWGGDGSACDPTSTTCTVTLSTSKPTVVQVTFTP